MALFSRYPSHLLMKAIDPCDGLPSRHSYLPSMKDVKDFLEPLHQAELRIAEAERRRNTPRLPEPPRDREADARMAQKLKELAATLGGSLKKIDKQGEEKLGT